MGVSSTGSGTVSLNSWTLVFSDPQLEHEFRLHQRRLWGSTELGRLKLNLLAGVINLSITTYLLSLGNVFTKQGANILLPYMTVAVSHYCLSKWQQSPIKSSLVNHVGEVCYSLICTTSMPTWALHGDCAELKGFMRKLILGSGILIGYWCRFLTPTFFTLVCFLTPLQFAFQAGRLTQPTCDALLSSPYGPGALQQLLQTLERVSQWALHGTTHPSTSIVLDTAQGCRSLLYLLQLFSGGTMLYVQYRMERTNRVAYLQGRHKLAGSWPRMRTLVQAVLHALVYLQLFAVAWVLQGASGSRGSGAPGTGPLAAAPGAAVFGAGSLSV